MISPYITAIQKVAGRTPGEKFRILNRIAKSIIDNSKSVNGVFEVKPSEELPEPLIPLVKLKIALILQQPEGIIEALKSENELVFTHALKAKWLFNGSNENYSAAYFRDNLFPVISVHHRMKIIKVIAGNLAAKNLVSVTEEFYNVISQTYGHSQARRFLKSCSESFIENIIKNEQVILYPSEVNYLYSRYPNMIAEYLKTQKTSTHVIYGFGTFEQSYIKILPKLLKKHSHHFVAIIRKHGLVDLRLWSRHHIELFLKNELDAFIKDPKLFLPILPAKVVIKKLTPHQITEIAKAYFPEKFEEFNFDVIYKEVVMYAFKEQQMPIMMSCFEEVYHKNLLDHSDKLTVQAIRLLPPDERIKQTRIKLEIDKDWYINGSGWYMTRSWRCYLPIEESVPQIKNKIIECEDASQRVSLLMQLLYTSRINDDKNALLDALKYIYARHRNERGWVWKSIFDRLEMDFDLPRLPAEHWDILYKIVLNNVESSSGDYETVVEFWNMIKHRIHFDLIHNQSITDKIKLMIRINLSNTAIDKWNIIEEVPEYEKKCLNEFLNVLPIELVAEKQEHTYVWKTAVLDLVKAIYNFNERHCKKAENQSQKFWVRNYSWLIDAIKNIFNESNQPSNEFYITTLTDALELNEPDLLIEIQPVPSKKVSIINIEKAANILRRQPGRILKNWEKYYKKCKKLSHRNFTIRFLKACCWHQDIPVKFIEQAMEEYRDYQTNESLIIASALLDGPSFELFIVPFMPIFIDNNETPLDKSDPMLSSIQTCLKYLNPPISSDFVLQFCKPDYIHCILEYILYAGRRIPVNQLLPFCDQLIDQAVSVRKHVSRLLQMAATNKELCIRLIILWRNEIHKSVRSIIAHQIFNCFIKYPCSESWKNMSECFDNITDKERNVLEVPLRNIIKVPSQYIGDYIKKLFNVFERIGDNEKKMYPFGVWYYTLNLFQEIIPDIASKFPEEFHRELLEKYLIDSTLPKEILAVSRKYLITVYIGSAGDELDNRLKFFSEIFTRIVKDKWDEPINENSSFCPANYFVHQLIEDIVYQMKNTQTKKKLIDTALKTFLILLQPQQEPEFYCNFSFASVYYDKMPWEQFTIKIHELLPIMLKIFSSEFIYYIAQFIHKLIQLYYGEKLQLNIIERLTTFNDDNANSLAAALLLSEKQQTNDERFWTIFRALRKHRHPLVTSTAYMIVHSVRDYAS